MPSKKTMRIDGLIDHLADKYIAKIYGISPRSFIYFIELLHTITDDNFNSYKWLHNVKEYNLHDKNTDTIIEQLEIFERIIDTDKYTADKSIYLNQLMSELTNLIKLTKTLDDNAVSNIKYHITLLKNETLNHEFVASDGFSQEGEDLILKRLFPEDIKGFYVDIGAHHPTRFSNTYLLYKQGWRGINIDPRPGIMELFDLMRPEDINIEYAIGDGKSSHQNAHYIRFHEPAYNSVYFGNKEDVENLGKSEILDIRDISVKSLDEILEEHSDAFNHINLLSIDVEGLEKQVLKGFSIERYRPDVIVIEIRGFDISMCDSFEEYNLLINCGYKLRSVLYNSLIFQSAYTSA